MISRYVTTNVTDLLSYLFLKSNIYCCLQLIFRICVLLLLIVLLERFLKRRRRFVDVSVVFSFLLWSLVLQVFDISKVIKSTQHLIPVEWWCLVYTDGCFAYYKMSSCALSTCRREQQQKQQIDRCLHHTRAMMCAH